MAELYQLHVHPIPYTYKPNETQAASISKTIVNDAVVLTPKQLADKVASGHSVCLGVMNGTRSKNNLISQQILMLDFDNTVHVNGVKTKVPDEDYVTISDILESQWMNNHAAFVYKSFSYQEDWQKFRVVIFLEKILRTHEEVTATYEYLMAQYPQADPSPKDCSRIFYGGTEVIEIDFNNTWEPKQKEKSQRETPKLNQMKFSNVKPLTKRQASQMMRGYIDREKDNLQEYGNALSAISVLGKAVLTGEIQEDWAREYVELLAMDNEAWKKENVVKLNEFLGKKVDDVYTNYTFVEKFSANTSSDDFDIFEFTQEVINEYEIVYYKKKLYVKSNQVWSCDENTLLRTINENRKLKKSQDAEVVHQLEKMAPEYDGDINVIQLRNEYQIQGGRIKKGTSEEFTPYLLDVTYDPQAYNKDVDDFLNFLVMDRPELRINVEELLGHMLLLKGFPHKVFFLVGEKGGNGKSTFLEMLNNFVGDLGSNVNLDAFNDATSVAELEDKIVNIGDDIDASYLDKSMNFKTLASGNVITIRPIYQTARKLKNSATLIFTANDMPTFRDKSGGIERRLAIIPCDNVVKQADFEMDAKLSTDEAKSYILNLALKGVESIRRNGGKLTENETMKSVLNQYMEDSDSILAFINEVGIRNEEDIKVTYQEYKDYCEAIGTKAQKQASLTRKLTSMGYEIVEKRRLGKKVRLHVLMEEKE